MKLLVTLFALVATVSSAPQGFGLDTQDAEFVPSGIPRGSTGGGSFPGGFGGSFPGGFGDSFPGGFGGSFPDGFDVHFINTRPRPNRPSFIDLLFGRVPTDDLPKPTNKTTNPSIFRDIIDGFFGGNIFPSIFQETPRPSSFPSLLPHFPDIPDVPSLGDLPDGYNNSTHEVKVVNGSRVEVNQTVTKSEGDGVVFTQIFIRVSPDQDGPTEGDSAPGSPAVGDEEVAPQTPQAEGTEPGSDPSTNQVLDEPIEDFGRDSSTKLIRHRRWLAEWLKNFSSSRRRTNSLPEPIRRVPEPTTNEIATVRSLVGDTDVNYSGVRLRHNPDVEVFDVDLMREDEDRFLARRPQPIMSQPIRSQPIRSQPIRSQPIRSQPIRSKRIRSQSILSKPHQTYKKSSRIPK